MTSLIDQFNDPAPRLSERLYDFWSLNYPNFLELQRKSAELYMQNGSVLTSCDLFKQLSMYEECVECLAMAGLIGQAKEMALSLLKDHQETPKLLCVLGDLFNEESYYKRSWVLSKKKFARAKRSLARLYFSRQDYEKAIKAFKKALEINNFNAASWFTLGCIYLKKNDFCEGIKAFGSCVQIDESNGEAWANLSACFLKDERKKEALSCLEQAVKYNENSWRIWSNLMFLSIELKKFARFLESVQKLVNLQKKEAIDQEVLKKIVQIFGYFVEKYRGNNVDQRILRFYQGIVERTLKLCLEKLGEKWEAWDAWADYQQVFIEFSELLEEKNKEKDEKNEEKSEKNEEKNEGKNEKNEGKKIAKIEEFAKKSVKFATSEIPQKKPDFASKKPEFLEKIYENRLKSCQCLMVIGWETSTPLCEKLLVQAHKLLASFHDLPAPKDSTQLALFLETVNFRLLKVLGISLEELPQMF